MKSIETNIHLPKVIVSWKVFEMLKLAKITILLLCQAPRSK